MNSRPASFAEVSFLEAAARCVAVWLSVEPVVPDGQKRLVSRFLGNQESGRTALAPPETTKGEKVFLPVGWALGLSFELGSLWLRADTEVLDHCLFRYSPARRVEAVVIGQPQKILSGTRRELPRHCEPDASTVSATVWPWHSFESGDFAIRYIGQLANWTNNGLALRLEHPVDLETGDRAAIQLQSHSRGQCPILWGKLKHCTAMPNGLWTAGFGDLADLGPGEAPGLMQYLATVPE